MQQRAVAIIGGGFSGSLLALHLLQSDRNLHIHLIEKGPWFARGAAYSTSQPLHLLNVRAANMSAYPDRPSHFQDWLSDRNGGASDPFAFAPRWVYGDYLESELNAASLSGATAGRLILIQDEAIEIRRASGGFHIDLAAGRVLRADLVVVATGHGPPTAAASPLSKLAVDSSYIHDPWAPSALEGIRGYDKVLLLGAGLTAVDVIAALDGLLHRGHILALSRRGLLPHRHAPSAGQPIVFKPIPGEPLSKALARFRSEAGLLNDWRLAFDGIRPVTQELWCGLSVSERRRFLRHLRPWWDIHRHRMAPQTAERIYAHLDSGRLRVLAGRLIALRRQSDGLVATWRARGETRQREDPVCWVINCTGAEGDPRRSNNPLIRRLIEAGLARPDPLNLGLDVDLQGRLFDAEGDIQRDLLGIGPLTRGALWEINAVPDIRIQAHRLADLIALEALPNRHHAD